MSRGARIGVGVVAAVVGLNLLLSLLGSLSGGTPGGPAGSSYATGPSGLAAYAAVLARAGHPVAQLREAPHVALLEPAATYVLVDPASAPRPADLAALRRAVAAGAGLVLGGAAAGWVDAVVPGGPRWSRLAVGRVGALAPLPALAGVGAVEAPGAGSWLGGAALPVLGSPGRGLLAVARVGRGEAWLLANAAPLENAHLGQLDDAALALALAGARARPVVFLESYHGFGAATGVAAVPTRWWVGVGVLAFAALLLMLASGRRLGPPQADARELPPPRRAYVEALAGVLARTRALEESTASVRGRARDLLAARAGLAPGASDAALRGAALQLGLPPEELDALLVPVRSEAQALALGAAYVRLRRESRA